MQIQNAFVFIHIPEVYKLSFFSPMLLFTFSATGTFFPTPPIFKFITHLDDSEFDKEGEKTSKLCCGYLVIMPYYMCMLFFPSPCKR